MQAQGARTFIVQNGVKLCRGPLEKGNKLLTRYESCVCIGAKDVEETVKGHIALQSLGEVHPQLSRYHQSSDLLPSLRAALTLCINVGNVTWILQQLTRLVHRTSKCYRTPLRIKVIIGCTVRSSSVCDQYY